MKHAYHLHKDKADHAVNQALVDFVVLVIMLDIALSRCDDAQLRRIALIVRLGFPTVTT